ncbi:MAG: GxxExxY protein [Verrucomicrobiales bacterium]|nr:GxxExxY protein [Verrucomicrobiales bacterium]
MQTTTTEKQFRRKKPIQMNPQPTATKFDDESYQIIGVAMEVHNELGPGLREKPYEAAMVIALKQKGFRVEPQRPYPIRFRQYIVGDCIPDLTVSASVLVEIKAVDRIGESEVAQMLNYLRVAKLGLGLVVNFKNPKLEWKRVVLDRFGGWKANGEG